MCPNYHSKHQVIMCSYAESTMLCSRVMRRHMRSTYDNVSGPTLYLWGAGSWVLHCLRVNSQ